jgi:hypothetical protein
LCHFRQFYGFKTNVFPLGLLTNNPQNIHNISNNSPKVSQDIDVLCVGSGIRRDIKPIIWPEHRNINEWYPGHRVKIHEKIQSFKDKNLQKYNVVLLNERVDMKEFFNLLNRTKIYIEIPGMGLSTRSFCEALIMEKCILALKQHNAPWPLNEWEHYASLGEDYEFDIMEEKITYLLNNPNVIKEIEENTKKIKPYLNHDWLSEYVMNTIAEFNNNNYKSNNPISNYF